MWQAIYPDVYMVPHIDDEGTFTIPVGSTSDELTPLTPFTSGDGETTYTSKSSRYLSDFGYSYPEIKDWAFNSPTELAANVTAQLNARMRTFPNILLGAEAPETCLETCFQALS